MSFGFVEQIARRFAGPIFGLECVSVYKQKIALALLNVSFERICEKLDETFVYVYVYFEYNDKVVHINKITSDA